MKFPWEVLEQTKFTPSYLHPQICIATILLTTIKMRLRVSKKTFLLFIYLAIIFGILLTLHLSWVRDLMINGYSMHLGLFSILLIILFKCRIWEYSVICEQLRSLSCSIFRC